MRFTRFLYILSVIVVTLVLSPNSFAQKSKSLTNDDFNSSPSSSSSAPAKVVTSITQSDKEEIKKVIKDYYDALNRRDKSALFKCLETGLQEEEQRNPKETKMMRSFMEGSMSGLFQKTDFKMKPLRLDNLTFSLNGNIVLVTKADGKPIFENEPFADNSIGLRPTSIALKNNGHWYLSGRPFSTE